jgi:mRNA-decapping enzyme subunit 2
MELALWFYVDLVRTEHPHLQNFKIKSFCKKLTELCPLLWESDVEDGLKKWSGYKSLVPVRGVALFDKTLTKLMLIQGIESKSWSFPRGKIEQNETDAQAAIREAMEEVGLDVKPYLIESDYIERTLNGKNYKIFLCKNIPDDVAYRPTVRNEINAINWKNFKALMKEIRKSQGNYFLVNTMIGQLNQWAKKQRGEINENEIKLEVEEKLKAMLGVGEQPVNDPGRELLDMLRKSTAKKQLQDQQAHQMPVPFPAFPTPPMQGYAFHPPTFHQFQQMAFNSPFTPPVLPPQGLGPIPQLPPFAFNSMFGSPLIQRAPPIMQQPPSIAQLQRPSMSMRNDVGSAELLGLLNKKSDKRSDLKKPELKNEDSTTSQKHKNSLLALLGKATPKPGSQTSNDVPMQVPFKARSPQPQEKSNKDSSLELMALLRPKKMQHNGRSTPPVSNGRAYSPERVESPKPKFKILKRNENIQSLSLKSPDNYATPQEEPLLNNEAPVDSLGDGRKAPPPSKELLELIKQSHKEDDDAEIFEDYTDEEYNDYDVDEVADDYEEPSTLEVLDEEHKKSNDQPVVVHAPGEAEASVPKKFTILKRELTSTEVSAATPVEVQSFAPKKFTILKRNEELNASESEPAPKLVSETHEVSEHDDEVKSTVSTIKFSDDSEEEDYHDSFEGSTEEAPIPQQLENNQAKNELLNLLHGASKEATPAPVETNVNINPPSVESASSPLTETSRSARDDLMGLLHKEKEEPVTLPSAPLSDHSSGDVRSDLLSLLHKSLTPQMENVASSFSPEMPPSTKPGADLLNLLHKSPSSKSTTPPVVTSGIPSPVSHDPSHDLLAMLHKKPVMELVPETPTSAPALVVSHESISPSSSLMNTLQKAPAPQQQPAGQTPAEQDKPTKHSTNLLNLLFKR